MIKIDNTFNICKTSRGTQLAVYFKRDDSKLYTELIENDNLIETLDRVSKPTEWFCPSRGLEKWDYIDSVKKHSNHYLIEHGNNEYAMNFEEYEIHPDLSSFSPSINNCYIRNNLLYVYVDDRVFCVSPCDNRATPYKSWNYLNNPVLRTPALPHFYTNLKCNEVRITIYTKSKTDTKLLISNEYFSRNIYIPSGKSSHDVKLLNKDGYFKMELSEENIRLGIVITAFR